MQPEPQWRDILECFHKLSLPIEISDGIVEILEKAGYGAAVLERADDSMTSARTRRRKRALMMPKADDVVAELWQQYDGLESRPAHKCRLAAYAYARLATDQQKRGSSDVLVLRKSQKVI